MADWEVRPSDFAEKSYRVNPTGRERRRENPRRREERESGSSGGGGRYRRVRFATLHDQVELSGAVSASTTSYDPVFLLRNMVRRMLGGGADGEE